MSTSSVRRLYAKHNVKKKSLIIKKKLPYKTSLKEPERFKMIVEDVNFFQSQGYKIIFIDEVMFTYSTLYTKDYSS